jgi:hypothetical protein
MTKSYTCPYEIQCSCYQPWKEFVDAFVSVWGFFTYVFCPPPQMQRIHTTLGTKVRVLLSIFRLLSTFVHFLFTFRFRLQWQIVTLHILWLWSGLWYCIIFYVTTCRTTRCHSANSTIRTYTVVEKSCLVKMYRHMQCLNWCVILRTSDNKELMKGHARRSPK